MNPAVDLAEGGHGVGDHPGHLVGDGHVGRPPEHVGGPLVAGQLGHQFARDRVAAGDHHPGALGGERQRDAPADVRGSGGDDDDLACQSRLHSLELYQYDDRTESTERTVDDSCRRC
jgi:hypothetical protein